MKTVAIFEDKKSTVLQRWNEADQVVGERHVSFEDLAEIFNAQLPIASLVNHLVMHRQDCLEELLSIHSSVTSEVLSFTNIMLEGLIQYADSSVAVELLLNHFGDELYEYYEEEQVDGLIEAWTNNLARKIAEKNNIDAVENMMMEVLKHSSKEQLKKIITIVFQKFQMALSKKDATQLKYLIGASFHLLSTKERVQLITETKADTESRHFVKVAPKADFIATRSDYDVHFYEIQKQKLRVKYHDVAYDDVGHPRLLFAIDVSKSGKVLKARLAAIKGRKELTMDTPLYKYPYSNVFGDGKLCWSEYSKLSSDQIPNGFLSTMNNSHLNGNVRELFETFENKSFNDKFLVRLASLTVYDWC